MTRIARDNLVDSRSRLGADDVDANDKPPAHAGRATAPSSIGGQDGVVTTSGDSKPLFPRVDGRDAGVPPTGKVLQALAAEVAEARLAHQFGAAKAPSVTSAGSKAAAHDPSWLKTAFSEVGVRETKGQAATQRILDYFEATYQRKGEKGEHTDDSGKANAWCAAFVTWSLAKNGIKNGKAVGAREYEKWGEPSEPFRGAVVVLQHGKQKHVALLVGLDKDGHNVYLGGNQKDQVSVNTLPNYTILEIRKPKGFEVPPALKTLPRIAATAASDTR